MDKSRGFTLVELVVVIVITGIMAASIAVFFVPAINAYFDTRRRAEMTDTADTALRRMTRDVRRAVPNSIRSISATCFQLVPSASGGLYRRAEDIDHVADSEPLDSHGGGTVFDVLSPLTVAPSAGDFVVIGNQDTNDVYSGATRSLVSNWTLATGTETATRVGRITLAAGQYPASYDGGRFQVVLAAEPSVFYVCDLASLVLRRVVGTNFSAPATCPAGGDVLATNVTGCTFTYNPATSATQAAGFVSVQLVLTAGGESMGLSSGAHVSNVP